MSRQSLAWEEFVWRSGVDRYRFQIEAGGLFGTLTAEGPDGSPAPKARVFTLPMVAWEGLLDSLKTNRNAREKGTHIGQPTRSGAFWSDGEVAELEAGFKAGRSIADLAKSHGRTTVAIESYLEKLGLWMRPRDIRTS